MPAAFVDRLRRWLEQQPGWRGVGRNAGWLVLEKCIRWALGLTIGVWLARHLGPEAFGRLGLAQAVVAVFASLVFLGSEGIVVRELVRAGSGRQAILLTAVWLRVIGGTAGYLIALAATSFLDLPDQVPALVAIAGLSLLAGAGDVLDLWFQAETQSRRAATSRTVGLVGSAVLRGILILTDAPLSAFAWAVVAESALTTLALIVAFPRGNLVASRTALDASWARAWLKEGWPNLISGLAMMAYMRVDRILLGTLDGERSVGLFNAAATCVEVWYILPTAIATAATPLLTRLRAGSSADYLREIARLARILAAAGWLLALGLTLASPWLTGGLFGPAYREAAPALALLAWGLLFVFMGVAVSPWYLNEGLMVPAMWRHLIGAVLNVGLNVLFIPRWGPTGAAAATVLSLGAAHVFANALDPRTRPIFHLQIRALLLRAPASSP